jgi:hypothetical protein
MVLWVNFTRLTMRAPDWWESARFQAVCVASSWFRQSGATSSRPTATNAHRCASSSILVFAGQQIP